jgi:hypothetical protein
MGRPTYQQRATADPWGYDPANRGQLRPDLQPYVNSFGQMRNPEQTPEQAAQVRGEVAAYRAAQQPNYQSPASLTQQRMGAWQQQQAKTHPSPLDQMRRIYEQTQAASPAQIQAAQNAPLTKQQHFSNSYGEYDREILNPDWMPLGAANQYADYLSGKWTPPQSWTQPQQPAMPRWWSQINNRMWT